MDNPRFYYWNWFIFNIFVLSFYSRKKNIFYHIVRNIPLFSAVELFSPSPEFSKPGYSHPIASLTWRQCTPLGFCSRETTRNFATQNVPRCPEDSILIFLYAFILQNGPSVNYIQHTLFTISCSCASMKPAIIIYTASPKFRRCLKCL